MSKKIKQDSKFIQVFEPSITLQDKLSVFNTLNKKEISGTSPVIAKFENALKTKFESKNAIAVSNGSVALDLAFQLADLNTDDEVILPSFTIISCLSAVIRSGAKPVFCDVDPNSWNMTYENVEKVLTDKTKVILMVHTYGLTADAKKIKKLCESNNILLIEDTAEAHGQHSDGLLCGTFGSISTLSFYANKHMTTGEGGALLINDENYYEKALRMRNLDFNNKKRFQHDNLYWNYRMGGLQAALGLSQIRNIKKTINQKIKQAMIYNNLLQPISNLQIPLFEHNGSKNHYWVYGVVIKEKSRDDLSKFLMNKNIETRNFFWPLHLQNALPNKFKIKHDLPISENLGKNGLYLPLGSHIKEKDQNYIVEQINEFLKN